jgi:hypothetical protein
MPVVISQHLLNVFVQLANKRGFKKNFQEEEFIVAKTTNPPQNSN